jgi:hypothetical protein
MLGKWPWRLAKEPRRWASDLTVEQIGVSRWGSEIPDEGSEIPVCAVGFWVGGRARINPNNIQQREPTAEPTELLPGLNFLNDEYNSSYFDSWCE